jgi:hypothetical protein
VRRFARAASPEELLASDGTGKQASILDEDAASLGVAQWVAQLHGLRLPVAGCRLKTVIVGSRFGSQNLPASLVFE